MENSSFFWPSSDGNPEPRTQRLIEPVRGGGRKPVHTQRFDSCVSKVKGSSPGVNAFAVCTSSLGRKAFLKFGQVRSTKERKLNIPPGDYHLQVLKLGRLIRQHRRARMPIQESRTKR